MKEAIKEANKAFEQDEVPVGAIVVSDFKIIGRGYNMVEKLKDVTAHAEIIAITSAANYLGSKYLQNCTLYVTIEPCIMCAGAILWSQIEQIVFGAHDEKFGYSKHKKLLPAKLNVKAGILEKECAQLMKDFFKNKR